MASTALWGRERELDAAVACFERVPQGLGCSFAIVGEPGIGKTRLATELAQRAVGLGLKTAWGRAWESGGAPALWPWRQLLESLGVSATSGPLQLVWSQPSAFEFSTSDPRQARFELFDAVVRALREQGQRQPTLCVLDDLHAADVASLELADFAISALKSSPLSWVVTYRDAEAERLPVRDALARLARRCTVLQLPRLSRQDTGAMVKGLLPHSDDQLAEQMFLATSGNPLFLCETARALADGRSPGLTTGKLPVGQGVALVVNERVGTLSPAARELVELGAALGRDVPLDQLCAAAGQSAATTRTLAAEAMAVGLWSEPQPDRWLFSHALVRDTIYRALPPERRSAVQAQAVGALDALFRAGRTDLALARAMHALETSPVADAEQIAHWVLAAAQQARAQRSYEEVAGLLERTLRELVLPDSARVELLLALGAAWGDLGNSAALQRTFDEAITLSRKTSEPAQLARAVLGRAQVYVLGDVRTELLGLIDEALAQLPESEVALRARLLARKASAMTPAADPAEPLALARAALAAVAGTTDEGVALDVAIAAGAALGDFAPPVERILVNTTLVRAARNLADRAAELRGLSRLVTDHLEAGDVARADAVLLERDALGSSLGHPRFRWQTPLFRSMRAMLEGRFDVCEQSVEDARRLIAAAADENAARVLVVHQAWMLLLQDRVDALRALEPELLRRTEMMAAYPDLLRALTAARGGHLSAAREHLKRRVGAALHFARASHMLAAAGEAAVLCGELEVARLAYTLLLPHAESNVTVGLFGLSSGPPVRGVLGMLASAIDQPEDETLGHFEAALERTAAMGAPAHEAWVRLWFGQHLKDSEAGRRQLGACAALAEKLGMPGLAARAGAVRGRPAPAPTPAPTLDFALRPAEAGWKLTRGTATLVMKDHRGMGMLARLLERPGEEIHALELVSGDAETELADAGDSGEMLDEKARRAYRKRIEQLSERIEEAERLGDARDAERARTELEALSRELSRAVGIGGRSRRAGSPAERARVTAQRRLREAIKRIAELDAEVGTLLERTIRTGTFCAYEPNRRARP